MIEPITFLVWTENSPGVLLRLTTLFTRRKTNVESLTVSATEQEGVSRFTIVVNLDPSVAATIGRQIERLVEVRRTVVFTDAEIVLREIALCRATLTQSEESALLAKFPEVSVVDRTTTSLLLQCAGDEGTISRLVADLKKTVLLEFVRSGRIALTRSGNFEHDLRRSMHELRPGSSEGPGL